MEIKKCLWCLKEFETDMAYSYCSIECSDKNSESSKEKLKKDSKKGFWQYIGDIITSAPW